jgi:DNA polymerase III delta prime subunit
MKLNDYIKTTNEFKIFENGIKVGELNHAFLIDADDEILGETFIKEIAKLLLNNNLNQSFFGEESNINAALNERVENLTHSDILIYETFKVDDAKNLQEKITLKPLEAPNKMIIFECSELSKVVQNKLLKTLEEPPEDSFIFFLNKGATLLPTVLSRLTKISLKTPPVDVFKSIALDMTSYSNIKSNAFNTEILSRIDIKKFNNLTLIKNITQNESFAESFLLTLNILEECKKTTDVVNFSRKITRITKQKLDEILNCFEVFFNYLMAELSNKNLGDNQTQNTSQSTNETYGFNLFSLGESIKQLNFAKQKLSVNCNLNSIFDLLLINMLKIKYEYR